MIKNKNFREDLYYRLNVIPLYIPPLRDRIEDIPLLVIHFIDKLNLILNKNIENADIEFINKLLEHKWPGNVRELQNVMERAMILCESNSLISENIILDINHLNNIEVNENKSIKKLKDVVKDTETTQIKNALKHSKSIRTAAKSLGVSHTTLINKINKYNIHRDYFID